VESGFTGEWGLGVHQGIEDHLICGDTVQIEALAAPVIEVMDLTVFC
jgi:hypothetical protein